MIKTWPPLYSDRVLVLWPSLLCVLTVCLYCDRPLVWRFRLHVRLSLAWRYRLHVHSYRNMHTACILVLTACMTIPLAWQYRLHDNTACMFTACILVLTAWMTIPLACSSVCKLSFCSVVTTQVDLTVSVVPLFNQTWRRFGRRWKRRCHDLTWLVS